MAKTLQEQLLSMGLVNQKKAKKNAKELKRNEHLKRTGKGEELEDTKAAAEAALKAKTERDRELNRQKEAEAQQKAIAAQIRQLIETNASNSKGEIKYNFVDGKKVKSLYVNQAVWDRLSRGQLAIIAYDGPATDSGYRVIPLPVADKIRQRAPEHFILIAESQGEQLDEDDPYAAYQIPDDLMW
ncbi:DUF2058 domain-containing protein [Parathalassolituus penaei]|uniref:DUF2058 domain-containing protein n=1 Tax=Parathalassolituus penaei TaxID=2997323 RepID=A0A9X3EA17_9GAMM|nr:DUF2058 domain-containing protein [Parathalassolituus penaei]MCY0963647.1 DUF2058 domain-containing protein [Parathalassolituus penaei]